MVLGPSPRLRAGGDRVPPVSASLVEQAGQLKIKIGTEPVMVLRAVGRAACPGAASVRVGVDDTRIGAQWNGLAKATAMTATPPTRVGGGAERSRLCRDPRPLPTSRKSQVGRNLAGVFNWSSTNLAAAAGNTVECF
jgi:hypothetical protein